MIWNDKKNEIVTRKSEPVLIPCKPALPTIEVEVVTNDGTVKSVR